MNQPCRCKCLRFRTALTGSRRHLQESGGEGIKKKREKKKKAERVAGRRAGDFIRVQIKRMRSMPRRRCS